MKIQSRELLQDLTQRVEKASVKAHYWKALSIEQLNQRAAPDSWSLTKK
jgi:hypothetical protein